MKTDHPQFDDDLGSLLASTAADAAPPDRARLVAIGELSAAAFAEAARVNTASPAASATMFLMRGLLALAATAAVVLGGFFVSRLSDSGPPPVAELTLGKVLATLAATDSYRAQLIRQGSTQEVLGGPDGLRIETTPTEYTLIDKNRTWQVNEADNRATPTETSPSSSTIHSIDPLQLLETDTGSVAQERPTSKRIIDGREMLVYFSKPRTKGYFQLEAVVDPQTQLPVSLKAATKHVDQLLPLGELRFTAFNQPLDEAKLKVAATLTEDGRIGKVTQWQGTVALRPLTSTRWTPVCEQVVLRIGDWLRTDFQGANAVTVQLAPQTKLILGPGTLVELARPDRIVLHAGTAQIIPSPKADNFSGIVHLSGPGGAAREISGVALVRANDAGLATLGKEPSWLAGYIGSAVRESLGSLVATIDGRRVPLTVGYHKVSVEIRDQIARTTIEQSFVNHTGGVLEGQFHFPLPADASISGFGMWIGNELVEADIVEKQRAREIYETILREKRDPGLLEWTGGNLFKARVYPIPGHSEKRIKIVYTQVLPRQGDSYRYSYALQSDLLRQNPLRQLDLDVTVHSTQPLAGVTCPTHATRNQLASQSARVEFSAQKYAPTRDFEVVVQVAGDAPKVTFIPHRRGDDGYFMLLLQPPAGAGAWQRDLLPDTLPGGEPLHLLVLADTSASMDAASRKVQAEVLSALLGSLAPLDKFNLATCDVDCTWTFSGAQAADEKSIAAARETLAKRRSLGWTNLDRAFESVGQQLQPGTQVVYLGDGIVTTGQMDGPAFVQRLGQLVGGQGGTFHAVALSSSYDAAVLRGIAALGGGSLRSVSGEVGPQQTAKNLLAEITRPALKNIQLEFKGVQTARVYPRLLPNVAAGTQQIVLGRFLPEGSEQRGEVIVTGTLEGKPATFRAALKSEVEGREPEGRENDVSFIPRLWARLHLDELLAQGTSQEIQDEIVNLSEEYHLITPYTSLLVLETDADRERFKVKRRFQMRDGERFFAAARNTAQYQLVQQQIQRAGLWRAGLRQSVLASLVDLGRDRTEVEAVQSASATVNFKSLTDGISSTIAPQSWSSSRSDFVVERSTRESANEYGWGRWFDAGDPGLIRGFESNLSLATNGFDGRFGSPSRLSDPFFADGSAVNGPAIYAPQPGNRPLEMLGKQLKELGSVEYFLGQKDAVGVAFDFDGEGLAYMFDREESYLGRSFAGEPFSRGEDRKKLSLIVDRSEQRRESLPSLLPIGLAAAPPAAAPRKERPSTWPEEARQISRSLKTTIDLAKIAGGLVIHEQHDSLDEQRGRLESRTQELRLASRGAWLTRGDGEGGPTIEWATADQRAAQRGVWSLPYQLVLTRKAAPTDLPPERQVGQWWQSDIEWHYQDRTATIEHPAENRALLVLKHVLRPDDEIRILIDTQKHVALSFEALEHGRSVGGTRLGELVEIAGVWAAQRIEHFDPEGINHLLTRTYEIVPQDKFDALLAEQLAPRAAALTIELPFPALEAARSRAATPAATLADRLVVLHELAQRQKWPEAQAELARCQPLVGDKYFGVWLRAWLLEASRRNEELKLLLLAEARSLAEQPRPGEQTLAERLHGIASGRLSADEHLAVLDLLRPVYARLPEHRRQLWADHRVTALASAGREQDEIAQLRELVRDYWFLQYNHRLLATRLAAQGDYAAAYEVLQAALERPAADWSARERDDLYDTWANLLQQQGRYAEQAEVVAAWLKLNPAESDPYARLLAALVYTRREAEADQLIAQWLEEGLAAAPLPKPVAARTLAAIEMVLGDNRYCQGGDLDPRWALPLVKLIETHVERGDAPRILSPISGDNEIRNTDAYRQTVRTLGERLKGTATELPPAPLASLLDWCLSYGNLTDDDWKPIAAALRTRWEQATHPVVREALAGMLLRVLAQHEPDERLAFMRVRLQASDDEHRAQRANELFEALLEAAWTPEIEAESLALIDQLSASENPQQREAMQAAALYHWTDRMEAARYEQLNGKIERPDKLTGVQLEEKQTALRTQVRGDLSARLKAAGTAREDGLRRWLIAEHLTLEARLNREPAKVVEQVWELIGPANHPSAGPLDFAFRARLTTMLIGLAIRPDAPAAEAQRLLQFLDAALAAEAAGDDAAGDDALDARLAKYLLLVALDQPQPLAEALTAWSRGADRPQLWQRTLAYLKAELGDLEAAAALLERLAADDALEAADYRMLALWYQALQRNDKHRSTQLAAWRELDEWQLRNIVQSHLQPWQQSGGPTPGAIDPQLFDVLQALFAKSSQPGDHVYLVRSFYVASRDFRLLAALADAVVGQSSGNIYRFLKEIDSTLDQLDREATADELLVHIATLRERAPTPVDRRALDLLTMLVERRAAELKNQPGPHLERAVAALRAASKAEWSPGEPRLFAQLLADLGQISQPELAAERASVIRALHAAVQDEPHERLLVSHALAESLRSDGHVQPAIDVLEPALAEHRAAARGKRTWPAIGSVRLLGELLAGGGKFVRGEQLLTGERHIAANDKVAFELELLAWGLHVQALEREGSTSLLSGEALYRGAQQRLIAAALDTPDHEQRRRLVHELCRLYRAAKVKAIPAAPADAVAFGRGPLPQLLGKQVDNYQELVEHVGSTIRDLAGPLAAMQYYIERIEGEPSWLARRGDEGWRRFASRMGSLHDEESVRGKLGDLRPRLLALVLKELRRELTTASSRQRVFYYEGYSYFWHEERDEFARVAEEVLAQRPDSLQTLQTLAVYLYLGLGRHDRAIEILLAAHRRQLLDESGRGRLATWLQERQRFGESIAFLEPLIAEQPDRLGYRLQLLHAYFQTKQPQALLRLLAQTDKFFHEEDRWNEQVAAYLANSCLENRLLAQAVEYLKEAIDRRSKALNQQTTGDQALAQYYLDRAYAQAGLNNTPAAVDDAASAIVVWGTAGEGVYRRHARTGKHDGHIHPLDVLGEVLSQSPDLDAYVAQLDKQVAADHQDRPIVRKAIGETYLARKAFDKALAQFQLAVELAPHDAAIHARLVECYDALQRPQEAAEQLLASVELARRDVGLWTKLAQRLELLEQPAEAERARTSLVEMLPTETEGHAQLAEIRQQQNRWDQAAIHWRHVARLRKLEPAGLLGVAAAQIQQRDPAAAEQTLRELETTDWPVRFRDELLQKQLPKLRADLSKLPQD